MLVRTDAGWDKVVDVLVIGYGAAGAVVALEAKNNDAEVLIVEKQSKENIYNNSSLSGGLFIVSNDANKSMSYFQELDRRGAGVDGIAWTEPDIVKVWAEYMADNRNYIERLGGSIFQLSSGGEHPDVPGADSFEGWRFNGSGLRMMMFFSEQVAKRGIEIWYERPAKRLITNTKGEVTGAQVTTGEGQSLNIGARRAVVLACGGFEFNESMKMNYLKVYPAHFSGTPANTGDGIRMATEVGADLWHMNCVSARAVCKFPEYPWGVTVDFGGKGWTRRLMKNENTREPAGYIWVDRSGKRFTCENHKFHAVYYELGLFDSQRLEYPRIPSYWIFDQNRMDSGPFPLVTSGPAGPHQLYKWSQDNTRELKRGWIISAMTPKELGRNLGIPPAALETTVKQYNRNCSLGKDRFNRRPADLVPLDRPPFYAVRMWPGSANTQGGPRRNARMQIVDNEGCPIRGLYGAGELGSVYGMIYPSSGGNLAECIGLGRVAGENAARETARPLKTAS